MDAVLLSRLQFAMTIGFHYIFPPVTIGMAWLIVYFQYRFIKSNDPLYKTISNFWIKLFAITFSVGVATGITMEFQFGTNWADYSRFVGDIFGAPLAAEGIFAFFLESSFLGILIYGAHKVSPRAYFFSGLMVAVGSTLSAFWIIVANSWQQTPAGYVIENGKAVLTDFWAAVFNPSTIIRYLHTIDGALITGAFFLFGISAYYLLKNKHIEFARESFKKSMIAAFIFSALALPLGHHHAIQVAETQPTKLAAFEGHWETGPNAPILLFGLPNSETERTDYAIKIPNMLSMMVGFSPNTIVKGLKDVPSDERPPLAITFWSFHLMVMLGGYFIALTFVGIILIFRRKAYENKWLLRICIFSIPLPFIANEVGWIAAEVGRQPWIVQGLLKTKDAISKSVPAGQILLSIIIFSLLYTLLFITWIYFLRRKISQGPQPHKVLT